METKAVEGAGWWVRRGIVFVLLAVVVWLVGQFLFPSPPDWRGREWVRVEAKVVRWEERKRVVDSFAVDGRERAGAMGGGLARLIARAGRDANCLCVVLVTVEMTDEQGRKVMFETRPAHGGEVQVSVGRARFVVERGAFLEAVRALGVREERWYRVVEEE